MLMVSLLVPSVVEAIFAGRNDMSCWETRLTNIACAPLMIIAYSYLCIACPVALMFAFEAAVCSVALVVFPLPLWCFVFPALFYLALPWITRTIWCASADQRLPVAAPFIGAECLLIMCSSSRVDYVLVGALIFAAGCWLTLHIYERRDWRL